MTSKLEECARAMLGVFYDQSYPNWDCSREAYIRNALPNGTQAVRAALQVLREPDEAMKAAIAKHCMPWHQGVFVSHHWEAWNELIDAILEQSPQEGE